MLDKHLIAKIQPYANEKNIVFWRDYRVTVLQDRLLRLEKSGNKKFRDDATLSVFYRNAKPQRFSTRETSDSFTVITDFCKLVLKENRKDCRIVIDGKSRKIDNSANLKGTARTLDGYDGDTYVGLTPLRKKDKTKEDRIVIGSGVCSKNGVAVLSDEKSLTLGFDGAVKPIQGDGTDEYIFAYGDDYVSAVKALFAITGSVPLIPRFALGNWWSRYHAYSDEEYLRLLNSLEEQDIPLTVATIDMDWHYSKDLDKEFHITELGKNTPFYGGNNGWTGYTWNKSLFPDHRAFLKKVKEKNLKITLNLHPADGVRWFEENYANMAKAMGLDPSSEQQIKFDMSDENFINAYFSELHRPLEKDGVDFWWIDWQQGTKSEVTGLDPLWSLNHYHYLDNAQNHRVPLILSRYCGVGAHRYPLGFSGDTVITWDTLKFLPYFTATASNIGYTWWSHDIGGHMRGDKENEMYLRHIQNGVFSPINRLHCSNAAVMTKEPWAYGNGAGEIAKKWLRLRHKLIPYLYTAAYNSHKNGTALVEPLYYRWKNPEAYSYKTEYFFGGELLVLPVTGKMKKDGFARVYSWIPEGEWTDIFTGTEYSAGKNGKKITLLRQLESIPVLIKAGGVLPLSLNKGNGAENPKVMEICAYSGNGAYTMYEDGAESGKSGELFTEFINEYAEKGGKATQRLTIRTTGDWSVVPEKRTFKVRFKNISAGKVSLFVDKKETVANTVLTDCAAIDLVIEANKEYRIEVKYNSLSPLEKAKRYACKTLICAEGDNLKKQEAYKSLEKAESLEEFAKIADGTELISSTAKDCLKEIL
ncbi:MAG: alpha-xylosidase [Clostridia bacterium]|nr:alpha-xylosidase [Clostridia bacterium]